MEGLNGLLACQDCSLPSWLVEVTANALFRDFERPEEKGREESPESPESPELPESPPLFSLRYAKVDSLKVKILVRYSLHSPQLKENPSCWIKLNRMWWLWDVLNPVAITVKMISIIDFIFFLFIYQWMHCSFGEFPPPSWCLVSVWIFGRTRERKMLKITGNEVLPWSYFHYISHVISKIQMWRWYKWNLWNVYLEFLLRNSWEKCNDVGYLIHWFAILLLSFSFSFLVRLMIKP